jgi:hypothetical protein
MGADLLPRLGNKMRKDGKPVLNAWTYEETTARIHL